MLLGGKMSSSLNQRYISVEEASEYLCAKKNWMYQNHKKLGIPSYSIGRKLVFKISDLDSWVANQSNV